MFIVSPWDTIISTLDARDPYTYSHSERVAALSVLIATEMGFSEEDIEKIHIAAHLHDIGKIGVPDVVLNKEGRLSKEELIQMQSHSLIGSNILHKIDYFKEIEIIVLHHHGRFDGEGYPNNIKGEAIPIESRIISVADSFDAITSDRPYRRGSSYQVGMEEVNLHENDQFCDTAFVGHEDLIHSRRIID